MADPRRETQVAELVDRLGVDETVVVWDEVRDRWDTGVRSWDHYDPDADWHLVIQDDAVVCRDLLPGLALALAGLPDLSVASLYSSGKFPWGRSGDPDAAWVKRARLVWGVAMAAPVDSIDDMLDWTERNGVSNYDHRIARYYEWHGWSAYFTRPSLVDHGRVPSLIDHPDGRHASRFIGEDASALDWAHADLERGNRHG